MEVRQKARSTTAGNDSYTGPSGQITVDTDRNELRLHDGATAGGLRIINLTQAQALFMAIDAGIADIVGLTGALDALAGLADANVFTANQEISKASPLLTLKAAGGADDAYFKVTDENDYTRILLGFDRTNSLLRGAYYDNTGTLVGEFAFDGTRLYADGNQVVDGSDLAAKEDWWAATAGKVLEAEELKLSGAFVTLSISAAAVALNGEGFINGDLALTESATLSNMTSPIVGRRYKVRVTNAGAYALAFGSNYVFPNGGTPPDVESGAGKITNLYLDVETATRIVVFNANDITS